MCNTCRAAVLCALVLFLVMRSRAADTITVAKAPLRAHNYDIASQIVDVAEGMLAPPWNALLLGQAPFDGSVLTKAQLVVAFKHRVGHDTSHGACPAYALAARDVLVAWAYHGVPYAIPEPRVQEELAKYRAICQALNPQGTLPSQDDRRVLVLADRMRLLLTNRHD